MRPNAPLCGRLARVAVASLFVSLARASVGDTLAESAETVATVSTPRVTTSVSPDGRWLAVRTQRDGAEWGELSVVSLEDGTSRALSAQRAIDLPTWDAQSHLLVRVRDESSPRVELRTIDPANGTVLASARVASSDPGGAWARLERRKSGDGHEQVRILWVARGLKFHLPVELGEFQLGETPGTVFYAQSSGSKLLLLRHDMDRGHSQALLELDGSTRSWSISPDERLALVTEAERPARARIVDLRNGMLVDGPWPAQSAHWIEDDQSRYVALVSRGRRTLVDRVRDRQLDLGADEGAWPTIEPLPDGRFVVQSQQSIDLCDDELRTLRKLVAKAD